MANKEHLKLLLRGVEEWNNWRREHEELAVPDLYDVDLSGLNLSGANLARANLSHSVLSGVILLSANLSYADLERSNLSRADLARANLSYAFLKDADLTDTACYSADLSNANFHRADLTYANLSLTNLSNANLSYAHIRGTNLFGATLSNTNFADSVTRNTIFNGLDLRGAISLDTVRHWGPSGIGIDTIFKSEGKIPETFLRGCGVSDDFITYMHSLVGKAVEFYSCFISYSSKDQRFAQRLYADLQSEGVRCWYAPEDLKIGEKIRVGIDESIRVHDKLLLILSKNSIGSEWVEKEVETAMERERQQKRTLLFPIQLDAAVDKIESGWAADVRRSRNVGDFRRWKSHDAYSKAFERLLRDLKVVA